MFACNGNLCSFKTSSKKIIKWHVIRHHTPLESVPFHCTLCQYRAKNYIQLIKHFDQQKHKLMNLQQNLSQQQCIGTRKPYDVTFTHDKRGDLQILQAESIPRQGMVVQTEESVSLSDVVAMEEPINITEEDILQKAVKCAKIQEEEDFIPDYDDYSSDDITVINKPKDNSCQTDEDLPQRVSLLEEQLKIERETHKIETNKLADFIKRLQTRLDQKKKKKSKILIQ
ncbi:HIVEP [Mytilus coruscus]|uniref:HIVEP n=1 Tax=Mytilus coruscus TaxID=42192 RepID=A0A6J8D3F4_MYTCO|nr:HIVEP [Mytilus coruscus]